MYDNDQFNNSTYHHSYSSRPSGDPWDRPQPTPPPPPPGPPDPKKGGSPGAVLRSGGRRRGPGRSGGL